MNIQAIWENGVFRPTQPVTIKHTRLTIVVPDEEILPNPTREEPAPVTSVRQRIDEILGPYKHQLKHDLSMSAQDYTKVWHEHLEEKYLERR